MLKWTRAELIHSSEDRFQFDEEINIGPEIFGTYPLIHSAEDVHIYGTGFYEPLEDVVYVHINVEGIMICPDSVSGEELEVPFNTGSDEVYSFEETDDEGVRVVSNEVIELLPAAIEDIVLEAPLQVTDVAPGDYPKGEGWRIVSEEEFEEERRNQIDPRLAKLREFKQEK